jgi:glycine/D-amino acid oxidase-like deaminating enzyme
VTAPVARPLPRPAPPAEVEVVVVGAGLAGLTAATRLAERGVRVALLEAEATLGRGASWRDPGLLTPGLPEPAWRLAAAIGPERTRALYALGAESLRALDALGVPTLPATHVAVDDREPDELDRSFATLDALGLAPARLDGPAAEAAIGGTHLTGGLRIAGDRAFSPDALAAALLARAVAAGAIVVGGARVTDVADAASGLRVRWAGGEVGAHAVILAAGPGLPAIDARFEDKITPVREHALALAPGGPPVAPGRGQLGYVGWRTDAEGRLIVSGCRWATPHLEVGETDDAAASPAVLARILDFARRHLRAGDRPVVASWARITAHTCDGLPMIGPLPGDPTRIACAGFQGVAPALAIAAAEGVVRGLLDGASGLPGWLSPTRFA